jgi:hypothetical protein
MRSPESWDEIDLLALISNQREESLGLEFKRANSLELIDKNKTEISKDVSAFANSAGGVIVYGIEESTKPPHYATALSPIDPGTCSKERLENVINSNINPRIEGLLINPIELRTTHPGKCAYIVVIPEGSTAHQASDKRYYKRFNFKSEPMEDYEVRQTMSRASRPSYRVALETGHIRSAATIVEFRINCSVQNVTELVGHQVSAVLFVPKDLVQHPDDFVVEFEGLQYSRIAGVYIPSSHAQQSAVEWAHPLTRYAINFPKTIAFDSSLPPANRFTAIVKVFDECGLALTARYYITIPECRIVEKGQLSAPKRQESVSLTGRLD